MIVIGECLLWVIRVVLMICAACPIYPQHWTSHRIDHTKIL